MNCRFKIFALFCLLALAACGGSETTNTLPQADDPNAGNNVPLPPVPPNTDDRLTDLIKRAWPFSLKTTGDFSALEAMVLNPGQHFVTPMVGDPSISMTIKSSNSSGVEGELLLGAEDFDSFAYRTWDSLHEASWRQSDFIDGYFADDDVVVRVSGPITSGKFAGRIDFRYRQSGETQCRRYTERYCDGDNDGIADEVPADWYYYWGQWYCREWRTRPYFDVDACRDYMLPSASVELMGKFDANPVPTTRWVR